MFDARAKLRERLIADGRLEPRERKAGLNRLGAFLRTDPRDAGCQRTVDMLDVYVELALADAEPERRLADIAAHLRVCGPCSADLEALLAAITAQRDE